MRNIDKYYEDLVFSACNWDSQNSVGCRTYELRTGQISYDDCDCDCERCYPDSLKWLQQEYKEPLSEVERIILENIDKQYQWIARDKDSNLYIYENKPHKTPDLCWNADKECCGFFAFNHLFQMMQWEDEEPTNIEELIKKEISVMKEQGEIE